MLFAAEDQSKLDKRSLINLRIPLGWEQIGNCSLWLSRKLRCGWCKDLPASQMQSKDQHPGVLAVAVAKCHPRPHPHALSAVSGRRKTSH